MRYLSNCFGCIAEPISCRLKGFLTLYNVRTTSEKNWLFVASNWSEVGMHV